MRFRILSFLLLLEAVKGYLREVSIGVFVEAGYEHVYDYLNDSLVTIDELPQTMVNYTRGPPRVNISLRAKPQQLSLIDPFTVKRAVCSSLTRNMPVLISLASCQTTKVIHEIVNIHQVPILHHSPCDTIPHAPNPLLLPLLMGERSMEHIALEVIKHARWTEVVIFYEATLGTESLSFLTENLSRLSISTVVIDTAQLSDVYIKQRRYTLQHMQNYVTLCSMSTVTSILQKVRLTDLDLLGPEYFWLLLELPKSRFNLIKLKSLLLEGDNVAILREIVKAPRLDYAKIDMYNAMAQLRTGLEIFAAKHPVNVSVRCDSTDTWSDAAAFSSVVKEHLSQCVQCEDYEVLSFTVSHHDGAPHFDVVGHWHRTMGLAMIYHLYPFEHQGFNQRVFTVTAVHDPPFNINHNNGTWSGVVIEILDELARSLNFSYQIRDPPDGVFGILRDNGSFNGMMGMLQRKEVDFGAGIFTITEGRHKVVDFTAAFMIDKMIIVMQKPDLSETKMFLCLGPFSVEVWFSVVASIVAVGIITWLVTRLHPLYENDTKEPREVYSCWVNVWQIMGAILQQGMVYVPSFHSARFVIALWWLFTIVVVGTYNGNLIAFLTAPKVSINVNTLEDLVYNGMAVGLWQNTAIHEIFSNADGGIFKQVWELIEADAEYNLVDDVVDGFKKAHDNANYAFLVEKSYFEVMRKRPDMAELGTHCNFVRSKEEFYPTSYAFPFPKNSPYTQLFSKRMLQILEAGLPKHWGGLSYKNSNPCTGLERTTEQTTISLAEAQGAFYILGIGIVISAASLFVEWIYTSSKENGSTCVGEVKCGEQIDSSDRNGECYVGRMDYAETLKTVAKTVDEQTDATGVDLSGVDFSPDQETIFVIEDSFVNNHRNGSVHRDRCSKRKPRLWRENMWRSMGETRNGHMSNGYDAHVHSRHRRKTSLKHSTSLSFDKSDCPSSDDDDDRIIHLVNDFDIRRESLHGVPPADEETGEQIELNVYNT